MKKQFDKRRKNPQGLKVREHMWLENKNIQSNRPSKKLDNKRYGPFRIIKNIGLGAFQLELPESWMIHSVFNKDLLTRCVEPKFKGQHKEPAPPPTIINEEEEYKVEEVRKHRTRSIDSGIRVTACKTGDRRLLDEVFESKPIKRGGKIPF